LYRVTLCAHQNLILDLLKIVIRIQTLDKNEIRRLYLEEGLTASQIADRFGVSKQMILCRVRRAGVHNTPQKGRSPTNYRYRNPPYGLRVNNGHLVPDKKEMKLVRQIVELRSRKKLGWTQIVQQLNAANVPSRRGKLWLIMGVKRVFTRWYGRI
jgi:transposase-like protein